MSNAPAPADDRQTIAETIQNGATPERPHAPARAGTTATIQASAMHEYVSAGGRGQQQNQATPLPWAIDDLTAEYGADLYTRMLRDAQCLASTTIFKASILDSVLNLSSARPKPEQDGFRQAAKILAFCEEALDRIDTLHESLWNQLDAIAVGNKIAEQTYIEEGGKLWLRHYKVKPQRSAAFVVDAYKNILGLVATIPGVSQQAQTGSLLGDISTIPNVLPRAKFSILTFRAQDNDPRGTSILRAAYTPWYMKQQVWPEYLKFLAQFAGPSIVGTTAPDARADFDYDENGQPIAGTWKSAELRLALALMELKNGAAIALPNGAAAQPLAIDYSAGGTAFAEAITVLDKQIVKAVLHQTLATEESENGTRAQATVHQDALTMILAQAKAAVTRMIRADILRPLVRYNFGEKAVALTPTASLGETEQRDVTALMQAIAALERVTWFSPSQKPHIDQMLGLPARTPAEVAQAAQLIEQAIQRGQNQPNDGQEANDEQEPPTNGPGRTQP